MNSLPNDKLVEKVERFCRKQIALGPVVNIEEEKLVDATGVSLILSYGSNSLEWPHAKMIFAIFATFLAFLLLFAEKLWLLPIVIVPLGLCIWLLSAISKSSDLKAFARVSKVGEIVLWGEAFRPNSKFRIERIEGLPRVEPILLYAVVCDIENEDQRVLFVSHDFSVTQKIASAVNYFLDLKTNAPSVNDGPPER